MKKIIKKMLIILIVFVIVFEFCGSSSVYAASGEDLEKTLNAVTNLIGGLVSIILWIPRILITGMAFVINQITIRVAESRRNVTRRF